MNEQNTPTEKKVYQSPELKDLGKIGEVTNTAGSGAVSDGGSSPGYTS
ncbi:hypothetical protein [Chitinophaga sp. Cy-1792]|nr:hypothetical protein [Chitinophaga sp. Cy-1792]